MDEVKVGDRVILIVYQEDECIFCASSIRKIYPDKRFNDITRYDLDGFDYLERGEFKTKKQVFSMLKLDEEDIGRWLLELEDANLDIDKLRRTVDILILKISAQKLRAYEDRAIDLNKAIDRNG